MYKIMLGEIINECGLVCPYDDRIINQLDKMCTSFVNEREMDELEFSNLVECYLNNSFSSDIKSFIEDNADEYELNLSGFPNCVWHALTFYVMCIAILRNEDEEQKAIFSCSLQNHLLLCLGRWNTLNFQSQLVRLYSNICDYLDEYSPEDNDNYKDLVTEIFNGTITSLEVEGETLEQLETMGMYAWFYQLEHFWENYKSLKVKNSFLKALYFLNYWCKSNPCIYIHFDLKKMLELAGVSDSKAKKSLREIITGLTETEKSLFYSPKSKSSIIIKMIKELTIIDKDFIDVKLSPSEFFVYLYYEVLLELKLMENGGK